MARDSGGAIIKAGAGIRSYTVHAIIVTDITEYRVIVYSNKYPVYTEPCVDYIQIEALNRINPQ